MRTWCTFENSDISEIPTPKPKGRLVKIALVAVVTIVVVAGGLLAYWWVSRPQTTWLFKGAYAEYEGSTIVEFVTIDMSMRLEVVDYNDTHGKLLMYMSMEMDGDPYTYQETMWVDLRDTSYESEDDLVLETTYEDHVYVEGLGTRYCIVYEYSSEDMPMTFYVDEKIGWPIKMEFSVLDELFELTLVETNISGLK